MLPSDTGRKAYQPDNITFLREAWIAGLEINFFVREPAGD